MKLPPPVVEAERPPAVVEATVRPSSTAPPTSTHCGNTYALVIGISKYITRGINPLDNATNDSRLVINMHWNLTVTLILTLTLTLTG